MLKTHSCGELRASHDGEKVTLAGWVHRRRDHGGLIFIDLRDHDGLTQVVFNPKDAAEAYAVGDSARGEYVLQVEGAVARRPEGTDNPHLPTGEIEVRASAVTVLNESKTPPFYIVEEVEVEELLRLKYRYLDLRRETMQRNMILRHRVVKFIRDWLTERGFIEIETPSLGAPTPEGARDFLVPSRFHPGRFYALPQSPQQMKQLLMVAGFERYFQIARCFRDEDLRADRQQEFTQLDMEMAFVEDEDVIVLLEGLHADMASALRPDLKMERPFPRLTHDEAMRRFGTDKPDLRFGIELVEFSGALRASEFAIFRQTIESGGVVRGICVPGGADPSTSLRTGLSRKQIDELTTFVQGYGAKGLVSIALLGEGPIDAIAEDDIRSPVAKYFTVEQVREMARLATANRGDLLLLVADKPSLANKVLDGLRREMGRRLNLADANTLSFVMIYDFPLFEWHEEDGRWYSVTHPFTQPKPDEMHLLDSDPGAVHSRSYDLVCNGWEIGGGSIRIHRREMQEQMFRILGIEPEEANRKFGHMLEAFEYGAPPHGGFATGIDRTVAIYAQQDDIREVMAFPKTKSAADPLTGAPSDVTAEQLDELRISVTETEGRSS
ncbi:MAG: aspartate--tRNA ligase [Dehalococcoidia bacterium]